MTRPRSRPLFDPGSLVTLAADLKTVWTALSTDARLKKRIVRTVIHEVIADIDPEAAEIVLLIHWIGGVAGIWENWKEPASGEWIRTFAIITTDANGLIADIHDRMPVILAPEDYDRWLGEEPNPRGLMRPYPAEPMRMWPISTRVNKPENDDPSIFEPIELSTAIA